MFCGTAVLLILDLDLAALYWVSNPEYHPQSRQGHPHSLGEEARLPETPCPGPLRLVARARSLQGGVS